MKEIHEILKEIRKQKKIPSTLIAKRIGISQSYISKMEKGEKRINVEILDKWVQALEITQEELARARQEPISFKRPHFVPVIGRAKASFEELWEADDKGFPPGYGDYYMGVPELKDFNSFYIEIYGESMIDCGLEEGDLAYITPNIKHESGEIALVLIGSERLATIKRVFYTPDNLVRLVSQNPEKWAERIINPKETEIKIYLVYGTFKKQRTKRKRKI